MRVLLHDLHIFDLNQRCDFLALRNDSARMNSSEMSGPYYLFGLKSGPQKIDAVNPRSFTFLKDAIRGGPQRVKTGLSRG